MRRVLVLVAIVGWTLLGVKAGTACSVMFISNPEQLVANAELIVRATAVEVAGKAAEGARIRFRIESVLKGTYAAGDIVLSGRLTDRDDWNDRQPPYEFVRSEGRGGNCFANTYRVGGQFLLLLKRNANLNISALSSRTEYTVDWSALAPVNEQVRSADDPWVQWVAGRSNLRTPAGTPAFGLVLRYGSIIPGDDSNILDTHTGTFTRNGTVSIKLTLTDAELAQIQKEVDEIDLWNAEKYPGGPFPPSGPQQPCAQKQLDAIALTITRGATARSVMRLGLCVDADSKAVQELADLIGLIKEAIEGKPEYLKLPAAPATRP